MNHIYPIYLACLIGCLLNSFQIAAQILPPDLSCVRADTVFWDLPSNTCGTQNAYLLYASNSEMGPYTLLTSVSDLNQDFYFHSTAGNNTWFYYMETDADCPGSGILQSDTIVNRNPDLLPVDFVTVNGNQVEINWAASPSSQVVGYIIYRVTSSGTVPIDTVFNTTQYTDVMASPNTQSEIYYVVAMDACENTSLFDEPHFTTHVISGVDACAREINLEWTPYQNWTEGIINQEVWMSTNFGAFELIDVLADTTSNYIYGNANDGDTYCFTIVAIENNTNFRSTSNETCLTVDVVQPANDLAITNATVTPDNEVALQWYWNTDAELTSYQITSAENGNDGVDVYDFSITAPLESLNSFLDAVVVEENFYTYEVITTDNCGGSANSDLVSTIFLQGNALPNRSNQLFWTALEIPSSTILSYELFHKTADDEILLQTINGNTLDALDQLEPRLVSEANKCYFIEAIAEVNLPDGTNQTIRSRSNTICLSQFATIFVPNAFTPNGKNPIFKPQVVFGNAISDYQLLIFDRWGKLQFESNEIELGWDGRGKSGRDLPRNAYTYIIRLSQPNGEFLEEKGVFVLIR